MELEILRWKPECSEQTLCLCGSQGRVQSLQPGGHDYDDDDVDDDDNGGIFVWRRSSSACNQVYYF